MSENTATRRKTKTRVCFTLSMPSRASWDGKWSGEDRFYAILRVFRDREMADRILGQKSYCYSWSDGWAACVSVREVDADESRKIRRKSNGFCGYDWMVDRIISHGKILADHELPKVEVAHA